MQLSALRGTNLIALRNDIFSRSVDFIVPNSAFTIIKQAVVRIRLIPGIAWQANCGGVRLQVRMSRTFHRYFHPLFDAVTDLLTTAVQRSSSEGFLDASGWWSAKNVDPHQLTGLLCHFIFF